MLNKDLMAKTLVLQHDKFYFASCYSWIMSTTISLQIHALLLKSLVLFVRARWLDLS